MVPTVTVVIPIIRCVGHQNIVKNKNRHLLAFFSSVGWEILPPPSTNSDRVGGFPASHIPAVTSDIMMGRTAVKLEMMQCIEMLAESRWSQWSERWDKVWSVATSEQFVASFSLLSTYLIINPRIIIMIKLLEDLPVLNKLEIEKLAYVLFRAESSALHCLSGGRIWFVSIFWHKSLHPTIHFTSPQSQSQSSVIIFKGSMDWI